jgi:hypothetical protein
MSVADRVIPPWYARLPTDVAGRLCGKAQLPALVMSLFVIDSLRQTGYTPTAPEGVSGKSYLKIKQTAVGNWQLAKVEVATLCRYVGIGFGIGWPLGHPRATQASPKGHARVTQASIGKKSFVCNKSWKKAGWGGAWLRDAGRRPQKSPESPRSRVFPPQKPKPGFPGTPSSRGIGKARPPMDQHGRNGSE